MGKVFNVREINVLMGLLDYLCLDCEYIMMLLTYCVSIGKKTLHYAEKTAFSLYDAGITTSAQLAEEFKRRENAVSAEAKIRKLFGVGERAFTTKEKKFISTWINDMDYSIEIIEKAYEVTADATGKGAFPYANSVLERWNAAGLRTLEEIEASYKANSDSANENGSFNTDSFFEAAVKRSLGGK
jgi:DnaD/phage-associated family protein